MSNIDPTQDLGPGTPNGTQALSGVQIPHPAPGLPTTNPHHPQTSNGLSAQAVTFGDDQHPEDQPLPVPYIDPSSDTPEEDRRRQAILRARRTDGEYNEGARGLAARGGGERASERGYPWTYPAPSLGSHPAENGYLDRPPARPMAPWPAYQSSGGRASENERPSGADHRPSQQTPISHWTHAGDPGRPEGSHQHAQTQPRVSTSGHPTRYLGSDLGSGSVHRGRQSNGYPQARAMPSRGGQGESLPTDASQERQVSSGGISARRQSHKTEDDGRDDTRSPGDNQGKEDTRSSEGTGGREDTRSPENTEGRENTPSSENTEDPSLYQLPPIDPARAQPGFGGLPLPSIDELFPGLDRSSNSAASGQPPEALAAHGTQRMPGNISDPHERERWLIWIFHAFFSSIFPRTLPTQTQNDEN